MKTILLVIAYSITSCLLYSQEFEAMTEKELKQLSKEEKKAKRLKENARKAELTEIMLDYHKFALEADIVRDKRGNQAMVQSNINFIIIDSTDAAVQLGLPYGLGYNGLGGITIEGTVTKYELTKKENKRGKSYSLAVMIHSPTGTYDIFFHIGATGNADATVRSMFGGQLTWSGKMVPLGVTKVYKGSSI